MGDREAARAQGRGVQGPPGRWRTGLSGAVAHRVLRAGDTWGRGPRTPGGERRRKHGAPGPLQPPGPREQPFRARQRGPANTALPTSRHPHTSRTTSSQPTHRPAPGRPTHLRPTPREPCPCAHPPRRRDFPEPGFGAHPPRAPEPGFFSPRTGRRHRPPLVRRRIASRRGVPLRAGGRRGDTPTGSRVPRPQVRNGISAPCGPNSLAFRGSCGRNGPPPVPREAVGEAVGDPARTGVRSLLRERPCDAGKRPGLATLGSGAAAKPERDRGEDGKGRPTPYLNPGVNRRMADSATRA
ncbi:hypothetical protein DV517_23920 [Streptomyces sp. S816]|nr:hypothetical protein DV517_23920 [Streptomyces sp. S816]